MITNINMKLNIYSNCRRLQNNCIEEDRRKERKCKYSKYLVSCYPWPIACNIRRQTVLPSLGSFVWHRLRVEHSTIIIVSDDELF